MSAVGPEALLLPAGFFLAVLAPCVAVYLLLAYHQERWFRQQETEARRRWAEHEAEEDHRLAALQERVDGLEGRVPRLEILEDDATAALPREDRRTGCSPPGGAAGADPCRSAEDFPQA